MHPTRLRRLSTPILLVLALGLLQTGVRAAPTTLIEIFASADTYIASNQPDTNFGASTGLLLGYNATGSALGAERLLIRFDVSAIPTTATINSARLQLTLNSASPAGDPPMDTVLRRVASPWDEMTATWNSEPTWGPVRSGTLVGSAPGIYEWDVTSLVTDWVRGTQPNHGMLIIGDEHVQQRERLFFSREAPANVVPRLVVDFTDPPADQVPPRATAEPLPPFSPRSFTVEWSGFDGGGSGIAYYDVRYRVDGGPWILWLSETTRLSATFVGEDGKQYEFEVRAVDRAGNVEPFGAPEAVTEVDAQLPSATVNPLPTVTQNRDFTVSWRGTDGSDGSGIRCFDVQYRVDDGPWAIWQQCTTDTSGVFSAPADGVYDFEARAIDNLNNQEPFNDRPEASIAVDASAPFIQPRLWGPIMTR